jgi:hypothetical protein
VRGKLIAGFVVALVLPSLALASKPQNPGNSSGTHGKSAPKVMYVLKGNVTLYTAANGSTNGSITIDVTHSNYHGKALRGVKLAIAVSSSTKVVIHKRSDKIADGDRGIVMVRAPKNIAAGDLAATFSTAPTVAARVIDQGTAH